MIDDEKLREAVLLLTQKIADLNEQIGNLLAAVGRPRELRLQDTLQEGEG